MSEPVNRDDLDAESGTALPDKEAMSLLDLNADLDLALDAAAPIDAAVAANANVAAPIDAAVSANVLSFGSESTAVADQDVLISQNLEADAVANSDQTSGISQGEQVDDGTTEPVDSGTDALASDALLNINADLALDADLAAPINAGVAANANVAAPIDAAVSANIGSIDSTSTAVADQDAVIVQNIEGSAEANATQDSTIEQ